MDEVSQKQSFNQRKFISVGLFFILVILVTTGILIQIFENFEEGFSIHFFTAIHVFAGLIFTILSILHTIKNWRSLKTYFKTKEIAISKEFVYAFLATMIVILIAFLFAYFIF